MYIATAKEAQSALTKLQGVQVDGHKLLLKMSSRTSADASGDGHVVPSASGKGAKKGTGVCFCVRGGWGREGGVSEVLYVTLFHM